MSKKKPSKMRDPAYKAMRTIFKPKVIQDKRGKVKHKGKIEDTT
jgi:hypothetical protein